MLSNLSLILNFPISDPDYLIHMFMLLLVFKKISYIPFYMTLSHFFSILEAFHVPHG